MTNSRDPADPVSKTRRLSAPELPKRFYKLAELVDEKGKYTLVLDGRRANTPARVPISVPSEALADALAAEWNAQGEHIDPAVMPVTRLVNTPIDGVSPRMDEVCGDIVSYAGSDALCYRADEPHGLVAEQGRHWDPVLDWAAERFGARFLLSQGVVHVSQPETVITAVSDALTRIDEPFLLAGLHVVTTLTGSALLALALHGSDFEGETLWRAAHVDEDWNIRQWGEDAEAQARREKRYRDYRAAVLAIRGRAD